jgi:hypothetical protein
MKQSVNKYDFSQAFDNMNRGDNFTMQGRDALFEYLEELEQDTGEEIELDVIALCCDYSEHESLIEWAKDYFTTDQLIETFSEWYDAEGDHFEEAECEESIREYITDRGQLIEFNGGIIVSSF